MIIHRGWRFRFTDAIGVFGDISTIEGLLGPNVTAIAERIRADGTRTEELILARMDPTDDEEWDLILGPTAFDYGYERAAAARMMLLLMDVSAPTPGIREPYLVDEVLREVGWNDARHRDVFLHGEALVTFFQVHVPSLAFAADRCQYWLQGGWLSTETAVRLREELAREEETVDARAVDVAARLAEPMQSTEGEIEARIRAGISDLRSMLATVGSDTSLWIIED